MLTPSPPPTPTPGEVLKNESVRSVLGEGMPMYKNPFEKGQLVIQFNVEFPKTLDINCINALEQVLPPRQQFDMPLEIDEECLLMDLKQSTGHSRHQREVYMNDSDSDDEYGAGGEGAGRSGVQCQPQ